MDWVIIFNNHQGKLRVTYLAPEVVAERGLKNVAESIVPEGLPYKLIHENELPSDRLFLDAWEVDSALLTDGIGKSNHVF